MVLLDFNYLSSPEKLLEYQSRYFENELQEIDITNLNKLTLVGNEIQVKQFIDSKNEWKRYRKFIFMFKKKWASKNKK